MRLLLRNPLGRLVHGVAAWCAVQSAFAAPGDDADWAARASEQEAIRQRIAAVNEGELAFLAPATAEPVHHHSSRITITARSLEDGWVTMQQCHDNLDRVAAAQIVFNPQRSRALRVVSYRNMDSAVAEDNTVQLRGVGEASQVCLRMESRALEAAGSDVFELRNGPFMRRFLDGYYPLRLTFVIEYPASLTLTGFEPDAQPGFAVTSEPGRVAVEALFEGRLWTRFRFLAR